MNAPNAAVTPMMAQFLEIKAQHPDALLFYRMGDFYELFFDDAIEAAQALDITLTHRGKHLGCDIPMCGVPVHAADGYLLTLIRKGFRVAVGEQLEDPAEARKRGAKAVVKRGVVRVVTPGTLTEDSLLDARSHNFLAAASILRDAAALAWTDISTGELRVTTLRGARFAPDLARLAPRELLIPEAQMRDLAPIAEDLGIAVTSLPGTAFDSQSGRRRLCETFGVADLDAFGNFERVEVSALGALVDYIDITQKGRLPLLHPPVRERQGTAMQIDAATRRNLEITHALSGGRQGSLVATIDRTVTAAGGRMLQQRLSAPSCDLTEIEARLDAIDAMLADPSRMEALRETLRESADIDRALSRLALDRAGPRDLAAIRAGLCAARTLHNHLDGAATARLTDLAARLRGFDTLAADLDAALVDEPPALLRDGGFVRDGVDPDLDEARALRDDGRSVIAAFQQRYAEETGITSLKIRHNNVLGYFIETTATHSDAMLTGPLSDRFRHRQTTANALRFTTTELAEIESRIINAGARALEIEKRHYSRLKDAVLAQSAPLGDAARALAEIDVITGLATLARACGWSRPELDESRNFAITGGRHPVVEAALRATGVEFVPNDCALPAGDHGAIQLLTGPNMAGKSTFLRQNALIAILAQSGSFVPAETARIGLVDQLFSRVGASDDLARGRSTFMVEMVETAAILNQAGPRALVILDEIGRGTATYDGLSIAWATLEHLHDANRCRALFATHYHEMTQLADRLEGVRNATVAVREWQGDIVFLHEVRDGAADRSYGVQVAKLAGLPAAVVARAESVLTALEQGETSTVRKAVIDDLPLFSIAARPQPKTANPSGIETEIAALRPDEMTPIEALQALYALKEKLSSPPSS